MRLIEFEDELDRSWWKGFYVGVAVSAVVSTMGLILLYACF